MPSYNLLRQPYVIKQLIFVLGAFPDLAVWCGLQLDAVSLLVMLDVPQMLNVVDFERFNHVDLLPTEEEGHPVAVQIHDVGNPLISEYKCVKKSFRHLKYYIT